MRAVMVRQRGEGVEAVLMIMLVSQPIQLTLRGMIAVTDTRQYRIQRGRSRILALNQLCRRSQLRRGRQRGDSEWVCIGRGRGRMMRSKDRARGCWEMIEEEDG